MDTATLASTPTSAPSTGTTEAAPATSAPSPSITPDQRPTFAQAFATDAASQTTEPSAQPDGATTPPADTTVDPLSATHPSTEKPQGPIPFETHKTALDNARTKARAEVSAEFDRDFAWAKTIAANVPDAPATMQKWTHIADRMTNDKVGFIRDFIAEVQGQDPAMAAQLRSEAGRMLAGGRGLQPEQMPAADVQIVNDQGQVVGMTYSEQQLAARDAWAEKQTLGKVEQELQPFKQEREQKAAAERAAEHQKQVNAKVDDYVADVSEVLEITKETTPEERTALFAAVADLITKDQTLSPYKAAMQVRRSHVVPKLAGKSDLRVLDDLKTRAAANGLNPQGAVVAATHKPKSFNDPSLKW